MFGLFRNASKSKQAFIDTWHPLMEEAKGVLPASIPVLQRHEARWFIEDWNDRYENASESEQIGLAVLAYRVDIHRYAAGMLIEGKKETRLAGVRLLGYMRDESAWQLLKERLLLHPDPELSFTALHSLFQINERRAKDEFASKIPTRKDWPQERLKSVLQTYLPENSSSD